jgi:tetratricopeptide (TPR) repeat protein
MQTFEMEKVRNLTGIQLISLLMLLSVCIRCHEKTSETLPDAYTQSGAYVKALPYFNPDSCVLLIRQDVPPRWQGAVYENLFLQGPEDSPLELGFKHLDYYEKHFPADTTYEFTQLWRGTLYIHTGQLDSAKHCFEASYQSSMRHKRLDRAADAKKGFASIFYNQGKTADAIRAFLELYEVVRQLDVSRQINTIYDLSSAYSQSDDQREALMWAQRGLSLLLN